jgi:hypothetical protein
MTQVQNGYPVDFAKLAKGATGPALSPSKRKPVTPVEPSTKAVIAKATAKADAKRNAKATGPSLKADAVKNEPEAVTPVEVETPKPLLAELAEINATLKAEAEVVTDEMLAEALRIVGLASKQQAEAIRKAAAERKKVAPEGEKVKKAKELTQAQKDKLAKAEKAAETYSVVASAAMGLAGKGLGESTKMQTALSFVPLPALRWLAKQFAGVAIPKDKRSAVDIREFLRVELLAWKAPEVAKA